VSFDDGSTRSLSEQIDVRTYAAMIACNNAEPIGAEGLE
jgi:hypothetical protein